MEEQYSTASSDAINSSQLSFSIIITAFNRREFLLKAILSASNQTLSKSKYEIVVIKNFEDREIDALITNVRGRSILARDVNIGEYLVEAISQSRGDVLVFLDDDDEFYPDKLEWLSSIFKHENICYHHSALDLIDDGGRKITASFRKKETDFITKTGLFVIKPPYSSTDVVRLRKSAGLSNMSVIAARRSTILQFTSFLQKIESAQDLFICFSVLISRRHLVLDPKVLTKYRMHSNNVSNFKFYSKNNLQKKYFEHISKEVKSFEVICDMANESVAERPIKKMILHELWRSRVDMDIVDQYSTRKKLTRDLANYMRQASRSTLLPQVRIFARCMVFLLLPDMTRRFFLESRARYWL